MQLHFLFPRRPFVVEVDISIIKMIILIIEIIIIMIILIITTMIVIIKMVKMSIIIIMIPSSTGCHSKNKFQREIHCVNEDKLKHVLVIFAYDHLKCLREDPTLSCFLKQEIQFFENHNPVIICLCYDTRHKQSNLFKQPVSTSNKETYVCV